MTKNICVLLAVVMLLSVIALRTAGIHEPGFDISQEASKDPDESTLGDDTDVETSVAETGKEDSEMTPPSVGSGSGGSSPYFESYDAPSYGFYYSYFSYDQIVIAPAEAYYPGSGWDFSFYEFYTPSNITMDKWNSNGPTTFQKRIGETNYTIELGSLNAGDALGVIYTNNETGEVTSTYFEKMAGVTGQYGAYKENLTDRFIGLGKHPFVIGGVECSISNLFSTVESAPGRYDAIGLEGCYLLISSESNYNLWESDTNYLLHKYHQIAKDGSIVYVTFRLPQAIDRSSKFIYTLEDWGQLKKNSY